MKNGQEQTASWLLGILGVHSSHQQHNHRWAEVPAGGSGRVSRFATDLLHFRPPEESYNYDCREGPEGAVAG